MEVKTLFRIVMILWCLSFLDYARNDRRHYHTSSYDEIHIKHFLLTHSHKALVINTLDSFRFYFKFQKRRKYRAYPTSFCGKYTNYF